MGMKIAGEYTFNGPREVAFAVVRDPNLLLLAIPGESTMTETGPNSYEGTIKLKIGPVSGTFAGLYTISEEIVLESFTMTVKGKGGAGFAEGVGKVHFTPLEDGNTLFKYTGARNIGGKLASVGQRLIDSVSKSMLKSGLEKLDKEVEKRK
jgi:carbon monoxide dehydrogenase subunit G